MDITFLLAVLADIRRFMGALRGRMTFLIADSTRSLENARFGAFYFVVAKENVNI